MDNIFKKKKRGWLGKAIFFIVILAVLYGIFVVGYSLGQKGKALKFIPFAGPAKVVNTEVGKPSAVDFSLFWEAWNKLEEKSMVAPNTQDMIYGSISGMLSSLNDPYTVFFTPKDNKEFQDDIAGQFSGIGVEIVQKNGVPTVVAPLSDTPAEKAGIKSGDIIIDVDGTDTSTIGLNEAVAKIRGKSGAKVTLKIVRQGSDAPLSFTITRSDIQVKSVEWSMKQSGGKNIEYVKVRQFGDDTQSLFANFASDVSTKNPDGIILDLRNNPGGYVESAIDMASYFLDGGTVVIEKGKDGQSQEHKTSRDATLKKFKLVVLVNEGSASASEIVSGALQDRKVATLVGEKTFGKGCVQELIPLSDGSAVKITVANWFTPSDRSITKEGVTPDIVVKNDDNSSVDAQLQKALSNF